MYAQSYNQDKIALTSFITRMYKQEPWSGVKVFLDYENKYLISLVSLVPSNYNSENAMTRVAEVKSRSQANQFLNGSYISSETIIVTTEKTAKNNSGSVDDVSDVIKETSMGFVESMELITTFNAEDGSGKKVFIYIKQLEKLNKKKK